jgi:hypothetical protein
MSDIEQTPHEWGWIRIFEVGVLGLSQRVQQNQFADASTIDKTDAAEIKHQLAIISEVFYNQVRKCCGLITIDDSALALNDDDVPLIASF